MKRQIPTYSQLDAMDCGPTCLRIIAAFYGKRYSLQNLREKCHITREGVSMLGISDAAEAIGFRMVGYLAEVCVIYFMIYFVFTNYYCKFIAN